MKRIHVYRVTVFTGSEENETLKEIFRCSIALRDPAHLERIARGIMATHEGDEVSCAHVIDANIMD